MKSSFSLGEQLDIKKEYLSLGAQLCERIMLSDKLPVKNLVVAIGGESGSGKSTTAYCLEKEFVRRGVHCVTVHMDSYFKLPPRDNHKNRIKSLDNVGPQEVNMKLLNEHIEAFLSRCSLVEIPIVNYKENRFSSMSVDLSKYNVLIVEGVYSFLLNGLDCKIFMNRTYHETFQNRIKRTREKYDPLVESVLEIEHNIIKDVVSNAEFVVDKNYSIL